MAEIARHTLPEEFRRIDSRRARVLLVEGGDRVETAVLDLESLRSYRASFPAHLDADRFELK